jgi:hypothetical protein
MRALTAIALAGVVAIAGCGTQESLAGPTWSWTGVQGTNGAGTTVPPGERGYSIEFATDGTVKVKTACSEVGGTYSVQIPLDVTIDLAASLPRCADAALTDLFAESLDKVSSYSTDGGRLRLFFVDEVGAMQFEKIAT